jgi:hypothetical protein
MYEDKRISVFKDELLFALSLDLRNELDMNTISNLEIELANVKNIINDLDDSEDIETLCNYIDIAEKLISKFDNEKLIKHQFYVTNAQINYLDKIADENNIKGKGRRGQALRSVLNKVMTD